MQAHRTPIRAHVLSLAVLSLAALMAGPAQAQASAPAGTASAGDAAEIQRLIKEGQHTQALKLIDEALSRNPKDAQMRFRRGVALSMLDRKSEALGVFQKLVEDHPDMPAPYNNMAVIYGAQGDYDKARGALERAIRTNPAYATAYQNLGDVYAQLASQAYTKALQLDKTDTTVPPKLSLLRELTSAPGTGSSTVAGGKPAAVAAAPQPKPMPAPVPASTPTPPAAPVAAAKPTGPAPAPAVSVAAAPKPAPVDAKPAPAAAPSGAAEVEQAVKAWASAWSRRDMNAYFAAYASDYAGQAGSHKAWQRERSDRIATKKSIKVGISELKVTVNGDKATARFRQNYESDALSTSSRKTLQLQRSGGKWVIQQESVGG